MGYSLEILNRIRAQASTEYQTRIPEATQATIQAIGNSFQQYEPVWNEFKEALIHKIGKTILESKLFKNKLARFKSGSIMTAQDVEEIFIGMVKAEGAYDKNGPNPLGRRDTADVKVMYHRENRRDYYAISIGDVDFIKAFKSEATLDNFISRLINAVYSGASYDEWLAMKNILATYNGYFDYEVPAMAGDNAEATAKAFVKTLRKAVQDLSFPSTQYNAAGVNTWSEPSGLALLVHKDILAEVDVEVLAKAFNLGKTDIQIEPISMDDFGSMDKCYGILMDKDFLKVWDTLSKMETQRNAQGLFTNYFYHIHQILSASKFKNAVRLVPAS